MRIVCKKFCLDTRQIRRNRGWFDVTTSVNNEIGKGKRGWVKIETM
jgi:hypothetical protein